MDKYAVRAPWKTLLLIVFGIIVALLCWIFVAVQWRKSQNIASTQAILQCIAKELGNTEALALDNSTKTVVVSEQAKDIYIGPLQSLPPPRDSWGNIISFERRNGKVRLISHGPDQRLGSDDDIVQVVVDGVRNRIDTPPATP